MSARSEAAKRLVEAAAELAACGMSPGRSGNISVRADDRLLMSPTDSSLAALDPDELSVLSASGEHLDGPRPSKEVPLHLALYRRDATHTAVVHLHSPLAVAMACREPWAEHHAIPPLTPYIFLKVGQVPLIPYFAPGDPRQADAIDANPHAFRAALLANHGQVAAAGSLDDAVASAIEIEEAARVALALGDSSCRALGEPEIEELVARGGTPWRTLRDRAQDRAAPREASSHAVA